jgi:hypothetical protein
MTHELGLSLSGMPADLPEELAAVPA